MPKTKEQKRQEAADRFQKRVDEILLNGGKPTSEQLEELDNLRGFHLQKKWWDGLTSSLPHDYRPTLEVENLVRKLRGSNRLVFVEAVLTLSPPEGYTYPSYAGSGTHLRLYIEKETDFTLHHSKNLYGSHITCVFGKKGTIPEYSEDHRQIRGVTVEQYQRSYR